jgi:TolB-like protein/Tfp pilus assembly protein PilF
MSLFEELKRRNVFRVAITYMVIAWVVLQVADLVLNNIGAPSWVIQSMILLIILGLFISIAISWIYELTPEGIKKEKDIEHDETIEHITSKKLDILVLIALSIIATMFAWDKFYPSHQGLSTNTTLAETNNTQTTKIQNTTVHSSSIAVLPFVNMSAEKENEYFSDGLSEELLNLLAKVNKLKVAARTSSFKFKGEKKDISEIGNLLGVAHVLEGSVRKSGNTIRITAQLIKVDDGFHLWSETYDRELKDIFALQDEIASAIVEALKLPLLGHDAQPLSDSKVENIAAYDLYLLGKHHFRKHDQPGFEKAIEYYKQALEVDPEFALAYSSLTDAYIFLADFGNMSKKEAVELALISANKALELDPNNAESHVAMGFVQRALGNLKKQKHHLELALNLNPKSINVLNKIVNFYEDNYQFDLAFELSKKALEMDPLSIVTIRQNISLYISMSKFDKAQLLIDKLLAQDPNDSNAFESWGDLFISKGKPHLAIDKYARAHELRPDDIYMASRIVRCALQMNDLKLAEHWLQQARNRGSQGQWTRFAEADYLTFTSQFEKLLNLISHKTNNSNKAILLYSQALLHIKLNLSEQVQPLLVQSLKEYGYQPDQELFINQTDIVLLNAVYYDSSKQTIKRDLFVSQLKELLLKHSDKVDTDITLTLLQANLASLDNNLIETLKYLQKAIELNYMNHWELLFQPVYQRWQEHPKFIAIHQSMLDKAKTMREEYYKSHPQQNDKQ